MNPVNAEIATMNTNHQTSTTDASGIVALSLEALIDLDKTWGNARLGLVLADAYFTTTPKNTDELAELCNASPETIRRWLKPLINVDRVRVLKEGRSIRYKARCPWAILT